MTSFLLNKKCEVCGINVPDDFGNLLCMEHYSKELPPLQNIDTSEAPISGITDPEYQENDEVEDIDMVTRVHGRFKGTGWVMPEKQFVLYNAMKDWIREHCVTKNAQFPKFIWKPKAIDVGCGLGIGANILSQECDYVLGIDKNEENIRYAQQMFARQKNNVYWAPQVDFMVSDVYAETREFMKFDMVFCIELIEHLKDFAPLLELLKRLTKSNGLVFISSPNRNAWKGEARAKKPLNEHHVREHTADEFVALLEKHGFKNIELYNHKFEPVGKDTTETPIVAKCMI